MDIKNKSYDSLYKNKYLLSKKKIIYYLFVMIYFYTFIYSDVIRRIISNKIHLNVRFSIVCMGLIIILFIFNRDRIKFFNFNILILIMSIFICSSIYTKVSIGKELMFIVTILAPMILMTIKLDDDMSETIFKKSIYFYNILMGILTVLIVVDLITGKGIQRILGNLLVGTSYGDVIGWELNKAVYRAHTIVGHALTSSYYYLIFLGLNMIYIKKYNKTCIYNKATILIIAIIGVLLTNSKSCLFLTIILVLMFTNISKKKMFYIISIVFIGFIILNSKYFQINIIGRFKHAIDLGDITNGRIIAFKAFINSGHKFNILIGNGMGSSSALMNTLNTNNLEMPLFMFAYDYGIISTVLIYALIFINPLISMIKRKQYYIGIIFTIIFAFGNTYNGFAEGIGVFQIFVFISFILSNNGNLLNIINQKYN